MNKSDGGQESMKNELGGTICQFRQQRNMTQDEFASRLGVTPQAVSKWERGNGLPDVSLLEGICKILQVTPNKLFGVEDSVVENGDSIAHMEIKNNMFAEPLLLEFGEDVIPCVVAGLETDYINQKRKELVRRKGMLLPIIRLRDNMELAKNEYRIFSYDKIIRKCSIISDAPDAFITMIDEMVKYCEENYAAVLNKQLVKAMIDNLKEQYPGVADNLVPEQITYLTLERKLQEKLLKGQSIRDMVHILEELEEQN